LKLYTPRNLYALVTLTLKLDAEFPEHGAAHDTLTGCLIHALDIGTTLYSSLDALPEHKTPEQFVEMNIWRAFERAAVGLTEQAPSLLLANSASSVADSAAPSAFVGHGSARALAEELSTTSARLILSSPARLDPTLWELSFLWTRWALSKAAAAPLEPLLDETRQRWGWYGNALAASLRDAAQLLLPDGQIAFAFPAGSHAMVEALTLAASPEFELEGFSFRPHRGAEATSEFGAVRGDYRLVWTKGRENRRFRAESQIPEAKRKGRVETRNETKGHENAKGDEAKTAREVSLHIRTTTLHAATEILSARGEPLAYSWLHHNALEKLAQGGILTETLTAKLHTRDNAFQFLRRELETGLKEGYASDFDHWKEPGRVLWVRRSKMREGVALADRVDEAMREILRDVKKISMNQLEDELMARFAGLLTPEIELVEMCAAAYADLRDEMWEWREADAAAEFTRARELVGQLGKQLNFRVRGSTNTFELLWRDEKIVPGSSGGAVRAASVEEDAYAFIFRAQVDLKKLASWEIAPLRGFVVIPETQVALVREKLRRAPTWLKPLQDAGWEFLRVPYVEMLLREALPERAEFQLAWGLDPALGKEKEQMELF
jgi:hypothetical protein